MWKHNTGIDAQQLYRFDCLPDMLSSKWVGISLLASQIFGVVAVSPTAPPLVRSGDRPEQKAF